MKAIISLKIIFILMAGCSFKNETTFDLDNSTWKFCGDNNIGNFSDVLVFDERNLSVKNDTVFIKRNDSAFGFVNHIDYEYVDRKLYLKDFKGNIGRYCEK